MERECGSERRGKERMGTRDRVWERESVLGRESEIVGAKESGSVREWGRECVGAREGVYWTVC